jgi:hypothetical protein
MICRKSFVLRFNPIRNITSPNKGIMLDSKAEKNPLEKNAMTESKAAISGKSWLNLESM